MLFRWNGQRRGREKQFAGYLSVLGGITLVICLLCACGSRSMVLLEDMSDDTDLQSLRSTQEDKAAAGEAPVSTEPESDAKEPEPVFIYVHVCGEVMNPGVYRLPEGSRVFEAVDSAGGFTENAEAAGVNQAALAADGSRIRIPSGEEAEEYAQSTVQEPAGNSVKDDLVDINTAALAQLSTLPGIGSGKAAAIIQYREQNGRFQKKEDILKVDGIKEGTYNKFKDRITVS